MSFCLLYLDFDGVLHPSEVFHQPGHGPAMAERFAGHKLFEHVEALNELLAPHPSVHLVLSTSWVQAYGIESAASYLPPELRVRIVGATFDPERDGPAFSSVARGYQITADARRRRVRKWVALDDDARNWPTAHGSRLIATDPILGFGEPSAQASLRIWLDSHFKLT